MSKPGKPVATTVGHSDQPPVEHPLKDIRSVIERARQQASTAVNDEECGYTGQLLALTQEAMERLQEYRQGLIATAVTGNIDVRHSRHARAGGRPEEVADVLA